MSHTYDSEFFSLVTDPEAVGELVPDGERALRLQTAINHPTILGAVKRMSREASLDSSAIASCAVDCVDVGKQLKLGEAELVHAIVRAAFRLQDEA